MKLEITSKQKHLPDFRNDSEKERGDAILFFIKEYREALFRENIPNEETQKTYISNSKDFENFITEFGFSPNVVVKYANHLKKNKVPQSTRKARGTAVKRLLYWVHKEARNLINKEMYHNLVDEADFKKKDDKEDSELNEGITNKQVKQLKEYILNAFDKQKDFLEVYTQFIILKWLGLRISEICRLKESSFDWDNMKVKVERKGGAAKETQIFTIVKDQVQRYVRFTGEQEFLFLNKGKPYTRFTLHYKWKKIFEGAGLNKSLHDLRHFAGSNICDLTNGNPYMIKEVLGHKNIVTSQSYVDKWASDNKFQELDKLILKNQK